MDESQLSSASAATRGTMPDKAGHYPYLLYADGRHRQVSNACHPAESGRLPPAPEKSASATTSVSAEEKETVDARDAYRLIFTYAPYVPRLPMLPVPADGLLGWYDGPPKFSGFFRHPIPARWWLRHKSYLCFWCIETGEIEGPAEIRGHDFRFMRDARGIVRYKEPEDSCK